MWEMQKLHPAGINAEIEAIEAALLALAESETGMPSAGLKEKLQRRLSITPGSAPAGNHNTEHNGSANVVALHPPARSASALRFAAAAAVVLLISSCIVNFMLYNQLRVAKNDIAAFKVARSIQAAEIEMLGNTLEEKTNELAMMTKPGAKMIMLKGMELSPSSSAMIVWNTTDKSVYIGKAALPMPPQGKQYQLWALVDGKPVDAGVFSMRNGDFVMQKMKDMPNAQAFAVTLEKMGGSPVPTMDAMFLMGNV